MKKTIFMAFVGLMAIACNNSSPKAEIDEQKKRDSMDAAQSIKDSLDVEAKMKADMAADTSGAKAETPAEESK